MTRSPEQRVALVTGSGSGIGLATCVELASAGWRVVVSDVDEPRAAAAAAALGSDALGIHLDVTSTVSVESGFEQVREEYGRLDLLVNNAGIQRAGAIAELRWEEWTVVIDVNLNGVMRCLQAAARLMIPAGRGTVVNIASVTADRGCPDRVAYAASKAAVISLTRTAAVEWAPLGIRVNAVAPGYVETELVQRHATAGSLDLGAVVDRTPLGRIGQPQEVARAVRFLAEDGASYVTGQVLYVDGGFLADYGVGRLRTSPSGHERFEE